MLFVALSVIVAVCNVILTKNNIKRIISKKFKFIKSISFSSIMSNFLQSSSGNITSSAIKFKPGDKKHCFDIIDNNIVIYGSVGTHDHGSSKVKLKNVVNYQWEAKDYPGHLIAVHLDGKHIAYAIKVTKSFTEGMVRVVNTYSGQRALIKGMFGEVLDLQFAFLENDQILGCIDEKTLYIHKIEMLDDNLICTLMLCIDDPIKNYQPKHDKIVWCPFLQSSISNENDIVDFSQLVVWSRGGKFQGFNLLSIIAANGIGKHNPEKLSTGYIKWEDTSLIITWITLSPDGSTLGVGSDDGYIRFYQMYFHEKQPRCLHEWKPHNGKIISSLFFLDDLTRHQTVAYWKYALTGAEGNTEFKIWDCSSWSCIQTVSFNEKSSFIAELDYTSSYLVLTNRETRGLYVLQIVKQTENKDELSDADDTQTQNDENSNDDSNLSGKSKIQSNKKTTFAFIKSVSEFPLSSPVLSFCIVDAAVRKYKCGLNDENYLIDEFDDYDEENNAIYCVVVRLVIVQPKSVQECHILYQPTLPEQCDIKSSISNESLVEGFDDYLTDISGSSSAKATNHHRHHHHHNQNSSSSSSSSTQEKNTISEINTNLLLEKKRLSVSPVNITSTPIDKSQKSNSPSPIIPNVNTSSGGGHKTNPLQLNLMIPEAFSATSSSGVSGGGGGSGVGAVGGGVGVGGNNTNDNDKTECVSSEVLSTILMLARGTNSSTGGNKAENVNLLNFVNNKVIEDQEKRKLKQQKKNFSNVENTNSHQQQQQVGHTGIDILASGGSSPSLEVQEIMSHGCKTSYYNDDKKQQKNEKNKQNVTTTNWPKVPDVRNVTKHSTEIQNTSNVVVSSTASLEINDLSLRINQLIDLVQIQSSQINSLKNELIDLKKMKTDNRLIIGNSNDTNQTSDYSNEYLLKIEKQITKIIEQYLIRYEEEHKKRMDAYISAKNVQSQEMRDSILHYFNQFMFNEFIEKITNILITEIQRNVLPVIIDKIDMIKQQIQSDISQKLSITDNVLRENISQVCKSKSIIDAFGNSVLLGVKNGLQSAYVESMSNTLIPAYEKSSREMFKQLHGTFSSGIQEVMKQFDNYLSQLQPVEASTDEILERLSDVQKQLNHTLSKNRNLNEITIELKKDVKVMETNMLRNLSELIQKEIKNSFESQAASLEDSVLSVVRSQAHTPAPMAPMVYDVQDQIKLLLCQNQINKAFHQALIANDLSLVEYTLEKADYKSVFNPCSLEQTVLLSLIQQISVDMNNHSELKQRYLSDAILNLNLNDPVTKEHSPRVLKELYKNCQNFLTNYPKNPLSSNVRMIMMAIQGMGYKVF